ncbi:MAG: sugar ABC transporter ATP-binding protein [Solirubrobacterales bacterium]
MHKSFGGVHALRGAGLTLGGEGTVHVLIGENGSGKSTLLGVLSGQLRPDAGEILLRGRRVSFSSPAAALRQGIAMVSQETAVAPDLTVAENVLLGRGLVRRGYGIDRAASYARAREVLARLELDYEPTRLVGTLRPDQRQMVEIARALSTEAKVLILDEPTSSLTDDEVEALFAAIRQLKAHGVTTLFVSHRLPELFAIGDEVTVIRDGRTVAEAPIAEFDTRSLVDAMVGEAGEEPARPARRRPAGGGEAPVLGVRGLRVAGALDGVDLDVGAGEIVGMAGLVGAGRSELMEVVFGARRADSGEITLDGKPLHARGPRAAIARGVGYLPADRKSQGLVLMASVGVNLTMVQTHDRPRFAVPRASAERATASGICEALQVRAPSLAAPAGSLSGGNQQKVALGKWLARPPRLLLLDEPTRGVDVAAKAEIHGHLRDLAASGVGLLVSSSENEELIELCDRIVVLFRGRVAATVGGDGELVSEAELVRLAGGHI